MTQLCWANDTLVDYVTSRVLELLAADPDAACSLAYCSDHSALLVKFRVAQR